LRHCGLWHSSRAPPADGDFVHDPDGDRQADEPRELTFVPEDAIWAEADAFLDADAFAHDPADERYRQPIVGISLREMCPVSRSETTTVRRQPADDEPRELTFVDEDTFWAEF